MPHLFQVSIGPVQTFIASARRTRDLWFGSQLLSELAKAAAYAIQAQAGSTLIFPSPDTPDSLMSNSDLNVANKLVALVDDPRETGRAVQQAITDRREELWQAAQGTITGTFDNKRAQKQIDDMTECFWVALPLPEDGSYAQVRAELENLMAARKNTRDFAAVEWGGSMPKSSITGQLESVIPENQYPKFKESPEERQHKADVLFRDYGAGPAEHLSAVDLLKRHGSGSQVFVSTSHMAAVPFLQQFTNGDHSRLAATWGEYIQKLPAEVQQREQIPKKYAPDAEYRKVIGASDGALLFEERLDDVFENTNLLNVAKAALHEFFKLAEPMLKQRRPSPYYAILHADGDNMGAVIDHEAKQGYEQHRRLSQQLDAFAKNARAISAGHAGAAIYTGGDDVLALVPLHTLLGCARKLADVFAETMKEFKGRDSDDKEVLPTLSVGVAVVHHLVPLSDALDLARAAEKTAKALPGKNALAITVSKRSGGDYTVKGRWSVFDTRLNNYIAERANLSAGAAYELRDLHERMMLPEDERDDSFWLMLRAEATRILRRKQGADGKKVDKDKAAQLVEDIGDEHTLADLANELIVARLLGDAQDLADKKGTTP